MELPVANRLDFEIPPDAEESRCRSCGAPIVWIVTTAGRRMPLDLASVEEREGKRYAESHFVACPQRREWRRSK